MRTLLRLSVTLLIAFLVALSLAAPTRADSPAFRWEDLEVLPVHDLEWGLLLLEQPALVHRLQRLGERAKTLAAHLSSREDSKDSGSRKLQQELVKLAEGMAPSVEALRVALQPLGISEDVWNAAREAPQGPMRVERHAMRLPLLLSGVSPQIRGLHARLIPATEGALLALLRHRERLPESADALRGLVDTQIAEIRIRFWRVLDASLDLEHRIQLRRRLPGAVAKPVDLLGHVFLLPDLTPSQRTRLKALLVRIEAESGPDTATVQRVVRRLAAPDVDAKERRELEKAKQAAEHRGLVRALELRRDGLAILTAQQAAELDGLPPYLSAQARVGDLEQDLANLDWRPAQKPALGAFLKRHGGLKGRMMQQLGIAELKARAAGPDGPASEAVEMMRHEAYAEALESARGAVRELFTELLDQDQVIRWVVNG